MLPYQLFLWNTTGYNVYLQCIVIICLNSFLCQRLQDISFIGSITMSCYIAQSWFIPIVLCPRESYVQKFIRE